MRRHLEALRAGGLRPEDVTVALGRDANPANRVYRTPGERIIKVRSGEVVPSPIFGQRLFMMSGSDCDETGAAYPQGASHRIAPEHQVALTAPDDLEAELEIHRMAVALDTEARARAYEAARPVGVVEIPHIDVASGDRRAG